LLSPELARKLSVEGAETKEAQTAGGKVSVAVGSVESLAIWAAKVENLQVAMTDLSDLSKAVGAVTLDHSLTWHGWSWILSTNV